MLFGASLSRMSEETGKNIISFSTARHYSVREAAEIHFQKQKVIIWSSLELQQAPIDSACRGHIFMTDILIGVSNEDAEVDASPHSRHER